MTSSALTESSLRHGDAVTPIEAQMATWGARWEQQLLTRRQYLKMTVSATVE